MIKRAKQNNGFTWESILAVRTTLTKLLAEVTELNASAVPITRSLRMIARRVVVNLLEQIQSKIIVDFYVNQILIITVIEKKPILYIY